MQNIYFLAVEPIVNRTQSLWNVWFPEVFEKEGYELKVIKGQVPSMMCDGKNVFEFRKSMIWKLSQMEMLMKCEINEGDVVIVPDFYYPGLEILGFLKKLEKKDVRIVSFIRAGSYIPYDYTYLNGMERFCKDLEEVWLNISDLIVSATKYHRDKLLECRNVPDERVVVCDFPLDVSYVSGFRKDECDRDIDILFPGRLGIDKGYDIVRLVERVMGVDVVKSYGMKLSRDEYLDLMSRAKCVIMPARLETFGYAIAEALSMDVPTVVPDALSYRELVPSQFRYDMYDYFGLIEKIEYVLGMYEKGVKFDFSDCVKRFEYRDAIKNMIDVFSEKGILK